MPLYRAAFTNRSFYTETPSHRAALQREAFPQRRLCTEQPWHADTPTQTLRFYTGAFAQRSYLHSLYTEPLLRTEALHTGLFARRSLNTEKLWRAQAFRQGLLFTDMSSHRRFYTEKPVHFLEALLHAEALHREAFAQSSFTQRCLCTEQLLQTEAFTQRRLHTEQLYREKLFHKDAFAQNSLDTQTLLHRPCVFTQERLHREAICTASTQSRFYAQKLYTRASLRGEA